MDTPRCGFMEIIGPAILLIVLIWLVMRRRSTGKPAAPSRPRATSTPKKNSAAATGPTTSDQSFLPVVQHWFESKGWRRAGTSSKCWIWRGKGGARCWSPRPARARRWRDSCRRICELAEQPAEGLHTLYVSPLKALAVDVQRNLIGPIEEMGLPIRVETRTGDTPSDRKARQRVKPPQVLLTTPGIAEPAAELSGSPRRCSKGLRTIVVDELHGFAKEKRGDLLSLSMSRLQKLAPGLRRVGLSATISDPDAYRSWLAPDADMELVDLVLGDPGAEPDLSILIPENKIPWGGHSGYHAIADVMRLIEQHKTTLVFSNTRVSPS